MHWCVHVSMLTLNLPTLWALYLPIGIIINLVPYGAASGNRQRRQDREIVAAVLRQLVCDLCGDSEGAQQLCSLCGVSPYGAASGNRQRRQHRKIVAAVLRQLVCDLCGDSGGEGEGRVA